MIPQPYTLLLNVDVLKACSSCATLEAQLQETLTAIRQRQKSLILFQKSNLPERIKAEYVASQEELLEEDFFWQTEIVNRLREKTDERTGLEVSRSGR